MILARLSITTNKKVKNEVSINEFARNRNNIIMLSEYIILLAIDNEGYKGCILKLGCLKESLRLIRLLGEITFNESTSVINNISKR